MKSLTKHLIVIIATCSVAPFANASDGRGKTTDDATKLEIGQHASSAPRERRDATLDSVAADEPVVTPFFPPLPDRANLSPERTSAKPDSAAQKRTTPNSQMPGTMHVSAGPSRTADESSKVSREAGTSASNPDDTSGPTEQLGIVVAVPKAKVKVDKYGGLRYPKVMYIVVPIQCETPYRSVQPDDSESSRLPQLPQFLPLEGGYGAGRGVAGNSMPVGDFRVGEFQR